MRRRAEALQSVPTVDSDGRHQQPQAPAGRGASAHCAKPCEGSALKEDPSGSGSPLPPGIAIIGMAGRFPGAADIAAFWCNLRDGVGSITRFKDAELEDAFDSSVRNDPNFVGARAVLDGIEQFDAGFFSMHAREAELTDPQHRVFLECAWQALEDGGYDPATYKGAIGVFAGCSMNSYFLRNVCQDRAAVEIFTSDYQIGSYLNCWARCRTFSRRGCPTSSICVGRASMCSRPARPLWSQSRKLVRASCFISPTWPWREARQSRCRSGAAISRKKAPWPRRPGGAAPLTPRPTGRSSAMEPPSSC